MQLNVKERFALRTIFKPAATSLFESDLYDEFLEKIKITSEEVKEIDMRSENGQITWDATKDNGLEVEITEALLNLLKRAVKDADERKRIPYDPDDKSLIELARKILNYKIKKNGTDDKKKD